MSEASRNQNKTTRGVALQPCRIVLISYADIPSTVDYCNQLVLRMSVGSDMLPGRYLDAVDPRPALAGIAIELRPLPAIRVIRRREPPHLRRHDSDNILVILLAPD